MNTRICNIFNARARLAALGQRQEKTRALKQAMMQELLSGRTRLPVQ